MTVEKRKEYDSIDVRIPRDDTDFGYIRVNGRTFEDLVKASDSQSHARVPYRIVAGGKGALFEHFVAGRHDGESIHLFLCSCGSWGCWSISVSVRRSRRFIYWYHYGQRWFTFRRKLYEAAFAKAEG